MRYILFIAAFFCSSVAFGQGAWNPAATYNIWKGTKSDSIAIVPRDTIARNTALLPSTGQPVGDYGRIQAKNRRFYFHDSTRNRELAFRDELPSDTGAFFRKQAGAINDVLSYGNQTFYEFIAGGLVSNRNSITYFDLVTNDSENARLRLELSADNQPQGRLGSFIYTDDNFPSGTPLWSFVLDSATGPSYWTRKLNLNNPFADTTGAALNIGGHVVASANDYGPTSILTKYPLVRNLTTGAIEASVMPDVYRSLWYRAGDLITSGDSQTAGANNSGNWYTTGNLIKPEFRWTNNLANFEGRSLSLTNLGLGGTKMSWFNYSLGTAPFDKSIFNRTGNLNPYWSGTYCVMGGWNNLGSNTTTSSFFSVLQGSHEAMIARLLVDDWAGVSPLGYGSSGASGVDGFTTTGSDGGVFFAPGQIRDIFPFYFSQPAWTFRPRIILEGSQYVDFTTNDKSAVGLFFETSRNGQTFQVEVNGDTVAIGTNIYDNIGTEGNVNSSGDLGHYPQVIWLENTPASAHIRITGTGGGTDTLYFLGYGWLHADSLNINNKRIYYSTTTGNTDGSRTNSVLQQAASAVERAVQAFSAYPVWFVNAFNNWDQASDSEPGDPAHLTPIANEHVMNAFNRGTKLSVRRAKNFINL